MGKVLGYNFVLKFNNKRIAGTTQDELDIQPITKESITKANLGNPESEVTGHNIDISVSGFIDIDAADPTNLHADDLIQLALATGPDAKVPFIYTRANGQAYQGHVTVAGYTESTNSEDIGNFSMKFKVSGGMTPVGG